MPKRCPWSENGGQLYLDYHDTEWGVPCHNDHTLFEFVVLESAQAGLSWITILKRREHYKQAFANFDAATVAQFTDVDIERLLQPESGIIRNRAKIAATITNARVFLEIQREHGSFAAYQWSFVNGHPKQNAWTEPSQVPAVAPEAEAFSKDLRKRGFKFFGPTIAYAHMQACGLVNDHITSCFRHDAVQELAQ